MGRDSYCDKWFEIQDLIGSADRWPPNIRRLFWTKNLTHFQRILVCAFAFSNGLHPEVLLEWVKLFRLARDESTYREFVGPLEAFHKASITISMHTSLQQGGMNI